MANSDYIQLLKIQIQKYLKTVDVSTSPLKEFLGAVDDAYQHFDLNQRTLQQSLQLSADELLQVSEEMSAVFQAIPDQLFHLDESGCIVNYKLGQSSYHYLKVGDLVNRRFTDVANNEVAAKFDVSIKLVLEQQATENFEFIVVHERKVHYYEVRMMPLKGREVMALVRDITERKLAEEQIAFLAYHDNLTALPNNRLFKDRLQHAISRTDRKEKILAVMFLDLDRFKLINDTMGHSAGDELLKVISQRLIEAVRKNDSVAINSSNLSASVARLGGDEFTILLEDVENIQSIAHIAERVIDSVSLPMMLERQEVHVSTSIGIALFPADGESVDEILQHADTAMYHAKSQGRNNFQFYTESMNKSSVELLALENKLRKAVEQDELFLYYQPQVDIASGQLVGMEALIRWNHPEDGFISPGVFIPVAEETGMINRIGKWVIKEACEQGVRWIKGGYKLHKISVNVSARQLKDENLPTLIGDILVATGMPANMLGIELTESAIILDPDTALARLQEIKELGVSLSLDDFGTGYSSLSYLKRFPIDTLKIDQAFVRDIHDDHEDAALVKAIIAMAHGLGMDVVAEGVEVQEQLELLGANGCDSIQGFLFSRPLPAAEMELMLVKR